MKKIIVTGANGQLGTEIMQIMQSGVSELGELPAFYQECEIVGMDAKDLDITNTDSTLCYMEEQRPYAVVNCAAMTNVDGCEEKRDLALQVNALGARNLAMACEQAGAKLVHISTDYVFAGNGTVPYAEWELCNPQSVYGASKYLGEQYVRELSSKYFILRTAWLYGYYGNNFVKTIAKVGKQNGVLQVVNDQRGNPTNAADLAYHVALVIPTQEYGIYHCTGIGECSWYDFACEIIKDYQIDCKVSPCTTDQSKRKALRPTYSSLDHGMLRATVGDHMRDWKEALQYFCSHYPLEKITGEDE